MTSTFTTADVTDAVVVIAAVVVVSFEIAGSVTTASSETKFQVNQLTRSLDRCN
jgi:hypothetical protein